MKVTKWVDFGQEIEIDIDVNDVRGALGEAFERVTQESFDEKPCMQDVLRAFNRIATFFSALTDEHIALLNDAQRQTIHKYLEDQAKRMRPLGDKTP